MFLLSVNKNDQSEMHRDPKEKLCSLSFSALLQLIVFEIRPSGLLSVASRQLVLSSPGKCQTFR